MNIVKYFEEMSTVVKIVWGSMFVIVVGFIVTSGEESAQEKQSMAFLRGREIIAEYAGEACKKSIKDHLSLDIGYYPTQSDTDPMAIAATLTWRGNGKEFTSIVCNYHKDKGLTSLSIDGVEKLGSSAASPEARSESGTTVEAEKAGEKPAAKTGTVEAP
ncbi:MAG: hypothetical protein ACREVK_09720 [Gammaproteobacteria bacterium]